MSDHLKCCGRPHICQRACTFAAAEQDRAFSRYLADHADSPQPVLGNKSDAVHFGELLRDATFAGGAPVDPPKAVNPKDGIGNTKLPLHLWPFSATAQGSLALLDGMLKYGRLNWRGTEVRASAYVGALLRHVAEWLEGVNVDAKSGLHPLAHGLACLAIILDAEAAGTLVDDRNYPGGYVELADLLMPHVARLQALYADAKPPHHSTIRDADTDG
jgi:Domain of unknown function (DUF5664)